MLDLAREHEYLLAQLRQHADPGYQAGSEMVMKTRATVPINRRPATAVPDLTLELIDRVKHERQPMITKAVS